MQKGGTMNLPAYLKDCLQLELTENEMLVKRKDCFYYLQGNLVDDLGNLKQDALLTKLYQMEKINEGQAQQIKLVFFGVEDALKVEEPILELIKENKPISFDFLKKELENTHAHLEKFELMETELGLKGENYYGLKKFLWYVLHASIQPAVTFKVGSAYFDNRLHGLIISGPGKGKGVIKNFFKRLRGWDNESVVEISGNTHPEQLIGKVVKISQGRGKPTIEEPRKGYLGAKILINDEAQNMINEIKEEYGKTQRIKRQAMDCYGLNKLSKKLVDDAWENLLDYAPETQIIDLMHPVPFQSSFFDTGSFRRYECFNLDSTTEFDEDDAVSSLFTENLRTTELIDYLKAEYSTIPSTVGLVFTPECCKIVANYVKVWNSDLLEYPNPKVRRFAEMTFFSIKDWFLKTVSILHLSKHEKTTTVELTLLACRDCVQFLLESLENYCKYGDLSNTSDVWGGAKDMEITALEYLYRRGAVSQEKSDVSIMDFSEIVGELFGVMERMAKGKVSSMRVRGLIVSKQVGQYESKVWLNVRPKFTSIKVRQKDLELLFSEFFEVSKNVRQFEGCKECKGLAYLLLITRESISVKINKLSYRDRDLSNGCIPCIPEDSKVEVEYAVPKRDINPEDYGFAV